MDKDVGVLRTHNAESDVADNAATKLADEAMYDLWRQWLSFYNAHFRAPGMAISAADQMAFYEIAQPILRELAKGTPGDTVSADGADSLCAPSLNKSNPAASGGAE